MTTTTDHVHSEDQGGDQLDRGLTYDMNTLVTRRRALTFFAGAGALLLAGCKGGSALTGTTTTTAAATAAAAAAATDTSTEIPQETAGPYPGDGTNGPNVLDDSGIVRSDIRSSFGTASGVAAGVPLTIALTLLNVDNSAKAYEGAAVYLWHCDRDGKYSMYSQGITNENYLRGVQVAGADGKVQFTSIFPAAYDGRWPHIHFEVYESVAAATSGGDPITTSQLALPEAVCDTVYATSGYSTSVKNLAGTSLANDNVFGDDGGIHQLATVSGSVADGYTAALNVPVSKSQTSSATMGGGGGRPTSR